MKIFSHILLEIHLYEQIVIQDYIILFFFIFSCQVLEAARAILPNVEQGKPGVTEKVALKLIVQ